MRNPDDDVALTDGEGYMTKQEPYDKHLRDTKEVKQVHFIAHLRLLQYPLIQAPAYYRSPTAQTTERSMPPTLIE